MKKKSVKQVSKPLKSLILCADDFGQNSAICDGILSLAMASRINAISCMVNMPSWFDAQPDLIKLPESCQVGLHLNLTFGQALSDAWRLHVGEQFGGLSNLIQKTYMRALDPHRIQAELKAQLLTFLDTMDRYPDFIDGHQHVHQLPQVREALIRLYQEEGLSCPVRRTHDGWSSVLNCVGFPKVQIIACLGGLRFASLLSRAKIPTYASFAGIYSFSRNAPYRQAMRSFLSNSKSGGLIMCHPGQLSHDEEDLIRQARFLEWTYLMSDVFLSDLAEASCTLSTHAVCN